jgi:5-formyltetrahydrofolate cyclo-ligase
MTIARIRAVKPVVTIGLAFAAQEIERVPATAFDARLDLVLTELETIDFR